MEFNNGILSSLDVNQDKEEEGVDLWDYLAVL